MEGAFDRSDDVIGRRIDPNGRPRVSVVIATYNRAASLRRLLDAIGGSTVPDGGLEVLVVDDGSSDATTEVIARAGATHIRQANRGPAAARERGWRTARGDVVVFFDDDVVPRPDAIDRLVNSLDGADAVGATIRPLETGSLIAQYMDLDGMLRHRVADGEVLWVTAAATAFRRSALERVGGFDLGFRPAGEDVDLASRMLESGGTLRVEPTAIVGIGCPSRPWQLMRTLFMYGGGYRMLAARHAGFKKERTRSAMLRLDPREWRNLYRAYRQEASIRRSLAFLLLHAFVVIPYALGVVVGQRVTKGRERNHHVELVLEGRPVEILGHSQRTAAVEDSVEQTSLAG